MIAWLRLIAGTALGAPLALAGLLYLSGAGVLAAVTAAAPGARRWTVARIGAGARRLAALDRRRLDWLTGVPGTGPIGGGPISGGRAVGYLAVRVPLGLLGGLLVALLCWGAGTVAALFGGWLVGRNLDGIRATPLIVAYVLTASALLLFLNLQGIAAVHRADRRLAARLLTGGPREAYERRIAELTVTRAEVITAVDTERRRIERDLHDGVQQRLVALGMLLGRARRAGDPGAVGDLLRQAHVESADALRELREVAWRVYPTALDDGGLPAALETVAERCPIEVNLAVKVPARPGTTVETVAYFVVCEAVTNAAKHAGAGAVDVLVRRRDTDLLVEVRDDGAGGADPAGGGLSGLARRVRALDGRFAVHSPPGGPTVISAVLPCG